MTVYVQVPDIDQTLAAITSAGGTVAMARTTIPGGPTLARFKDPAGHVISLIQG